MNEAINNHCDAPPPAGLETFTDETISKLRASGNAWPLPSGQLLLPRVFGFCRGVKRALTMLQDLLVQHARAGGKLFLLGQIIHNPWVNDYFSARGVTILSRKDLDRIEQIISTQDCAVIPAFGIPQEIERRLKAIGCDVVNTSCPDVRRLWHWAQQAVDRGFGILIFGKADHDETVVTKSRLSAGGGKYIVVGNIEQARGLCELIADPARRKFGELFSPQATNAESIEPFEHLAQVSQTTMLYNETLKVRQLLQEVFAARFSSDETPERLIFEPTVCRATQDRQSAAVELCRSGLDLAIVVGGFGSSNTRHLYELAGENTQAWFIEDARAIRSESELESLDPSSGKPVIARNWLPSRRPLRIGVLAGASSPETVVGQVLRRLAQFLS